MTKLAQTKRELTGKQKRFINEYLLCLNATEAASRAGYSGNRHTLHEIGGQNLRKLAIRAEIDRIFHENAMSASEVLTRLSAQARGDLADIIDPATNSIDWKRARDSGITHLIQKRKERTVIRTSKDGEESETHDLEVVLYSSQRALEILAKYHQLLTDRLQIDDWRSDAIAHIRAGELSYQALVKYFDTDLATELFQEAGVPIEVP